MLMCCRISMTMYLLLSCIVFTINVFVVTSKSNCNKTYSYFYSLKQNKFLFLRSLTGSYSSQ